MYLIFAVYIGGCNLLMYWSSKYPNMCVFFNGFILDYVRISALWDVCLLTAGHIAQLL